MQNQAQKTTDSRRSFCIAAPSCFHAQTYSRRKVTPTFFDDTETCPHPSTRIIEAPRAVHHSRFCTLSRTPFLNAVYISTQHRVTFLLIFFANSFIRLCNPQFCANIFRQPKPHGALAQLARVLVWQTRGQGFESPKLHHTKPKTNSFCENSFRFFIKKLLLTSSLIIRRRR